MSHADPRSLAAATLDALVRGGGEAMHLLEGVTDALDDGVIVVDRDRNLLVFNRAAEAITGFRREEVLGRHCLTGIRCSTCLESCAVFERGSVPPVPLELFRADGERRAIVKAALTLKNRAGETVGAVEVFRARDAEDRGGLEPSRPWEAAAALLGALGRWVLLLDEAFRVRWASSALAERGEGVALVGPGQRAEEVLGEGLFGEGAAFRAALEAGERREGWRAHLAAEAGQALSVSVSAAPLPERGGCEASSRLQARYVIVLRPEAEGEGLDDRAAVRFEGMVARSPVMRRIFSLIEHLGESDAAVLVTGESGTGKELVARAVHAHSLRANEPFVAVNCGALPGDLLESELFGHARGAFTGAVRDKPGRFEVAGRGTLFLDEIGDLPLPLQVKLLRVLQERTFERVGENRSRRFEGRIISATHVDLAAAVVGGRFREDLFYRLNVVPIALPPLRERPEDIELLVDELMRRIGQRRSRALRLSPGAMRALLSARWPGNVRQLENALEYAHAVCDGQTIHLEDLPPDVVASPDEGLGRPVGLAAPREVGAARGADTETPAPKPGGRARWPSRQEIERALAQARGRRSEAARQLGISRTTLWRRMREYGLR